MGARCAERTGHGGGPEKGKRLVNLWQATCDGKWRGSGSDADAKRAKG